MSDFTIEAKNRLAKLLATENFSIEHKTLKTAYFDIKNRVLYCPIWKNMGADLYDMLLSHEASHAIYTDYSEWDTILKSNPSKDYCNFLNSIEDDRVNRKIQRKYPGLRSAYISGYKYLIDRDFFGTVNIDVNSMYFIDKLNIYSKSQYKNNNIKFTDYEWELIDAVKSTETLNDVKRVTDLVWDYSKKEQQNKQEQQEQQEQNNNKDIKVDDESTDESTDEDYTEEYTIENDVGDESIDEELTEEVDDDTSIDDESTEDDDGEQTGGESLINNTNDNNDFEPTCATEKAFNDSSAKLINNNAKEHLYINVPTPILENIITPHNIVYKQIKEYYDQFPVVTQELLNDLLAEFKSVNDSYIGLLVKEFEMKKAATKYSKTKVSNTGDIDIDKISSYKVNDDIFKRMTKTNNGKSHGLFLLLDRSGSMAPSMSGAIEQIIVLTMFCKRVNIPFVVYGFGNNQDVKVRDYRAAGDTSLKFDAVNLLPDDVFALTSHYNATAYTLRIELVNLKNAELIHAWAHGKDKTMGLPLRTLWACLARLC